jgi:hypothetical protein
VLKRIRRDHYAGALLVLFGIGVAVQGESYGLGTPSRLGSGFFPLVLGILLALLGGLVAWLAEPPSSADSEKSHPLGPDWRGWACIIASVVLFILLANYAGLAPAAFVCVFVAALGDRRANLKSTLLLASALTAFSVIVFGYALHIQIPILQGL